jgi:hypothetical protein
VYKKQSSGAVSYPVGKKEKELQTEFSWHCKWQSCRVNVIKNFFDCSFYDYTFVGSNSVLKTFYNEEERRNYEKWKATTVVELHQQKYIVKPLYNNRIIFEPPHELVVV